MTACSVLSVFDANVLLKNGMLHVTCLVTSEEKNFFFLAVFVPCVDPGFCSDLQANVALVGGKRRKSLNV